MNRPVEPQKKEDILERCLAVVIETGTLDYSINAIAKLIGTSGRMLVYHFGSKQELEKQMISLLEVRLREKMWSFQDVTSKDENNATESLIQMWEHLTSPSMRGLLKLTMELNQRAMQGDVETRRFLSQENQKWVDDLSEKYSEDVALCLLHLFQGAILDFLTTGNAQRGYRTIKVFIKAMQ